MQTTVGGTRWGDRPGVGLWWAAVATLSVMLVSGLRGPLAHATFTAPIVLFWLVTIGAGACWFGAMWAVRAGWRDNLAEVGLVGASLAVQSQLALVHGLTAPGVLFGTTSAVSTSAFISLPAAVGVALPLLAPESRLGRALGRAWRPWVAAWLLAATAVDVAMLASPNWLPAAGAGRPLPVVIGMASTLVVLSLSHRQLVLYWVGRRHASFVASIALVSLGLSGLVWIGDRPFSPGWWFAHVLDLAGVTGAAISFACGYRSDRSVASILAPVVNRDPLVALDLGLSPVVHRFVGALEHKDEVTRDHVVRVAELAVRAGERAGISGTRLRNLGLGALLHDVGKLGVPADILTKPGPLTEAEARCMQQHVVTGERLLRTEPQLAPAAPLVRWHHERHDGAGYPDGLHGHQIPLDVAIISAADAFDAMSSTRHYRSGMGQRRAAEILREHAGSQWDPIAVDHVLGAASSGAGDGSVLAAVGRQPDAASWACGCLDALPVSARREVLKVG